MGRHCTSASARVTRSVGASYRTPRLGHLDPVLSLPFPAIFLADVCESAGGTGGSGCGASAEGWRERPHSRCFDFRGNRVVAPTLFW